MVWSHFWALVSEVFPFAMNILKFSKKTDWNISVYTDKTFKFPSHGHFEVNLWFWNSTTWLHDWPIWYLQIFLVFSKINHNLWNGLSVACECLDYPSSCNKKVTETSQIWINHNHCNPCSNLSFFPSSDRLN